jgi:CheY-like chemotaxis protein
MYYQSLSNAISTSFTSLLFIDDDDEDLCLFPMVISNLCVSLNTDTIGNAALALAKLDTGEIHPDLIFLGLDMPVMNGQEFLRAIKAKEPLKDIPVIVMSTSTESGTMEEVKSLGAMDYFVKPSSYYDFKAIFKRLLRL